MKFLAIDTSYCTLVAAAYADGKVCLRAKESALRHSVLLMEEIDAALHALSLRLEDCDFIACAVGPGSFTGIRVGISAVKGLCLAAGKPALAVTSFDCLAYAERGGKQLALVDAGHGMYYACRYEDGLPSAPAFIKGEEAEELIRAGYRPVTHESADFANGLLQAALALSHRAAPAEELCALYLRRSAAEEGR